MSDFNDSLIFTLQQEGGFVNNIHDSGGATNFGITLATYREYQDDPDLSAEDLKTISTGIVSEIFLERFWNPMKCDVLPSGVDLMVFDHGVNAGISHSTKILQSCVGVVEDGVIGTDTLQAVKRLSPTQLISMLYVKQTEYYEGLADFRYFGTGWLARAVRRKSAALKLVAL